MARKARPTDEVLNELPHEEFVIWFLEYNNAIISKYIIKRLIPNRYDPSDVKAYMGERMLDILHKRKAKGRAIKNPRIYFGKLIDFWCIEYQRMHGYIYGMPKRPRNVAAEEEISKYGFVYLNTPDSVKTAEGFYQSPQLAFIDLSLTPGDNTYYQEAGYQFKGGDPGVSSAFWNKLMSTVLPEDKQVLECLFVMNLSIPDTSKHLGIAISTAYTRRDRGLATISGLVTNSNIDTDQASWKTLNDISQIRSSSVDITELLSGDV